MQTCTYYLEKSLALHIRSLEHDNLVIYSKEDQTDLYLGFLLGFQCPFIKAKKRRKTFHSFQPIKYRNSS